MNRNHTTGSEDTARDKAKDIADIVEDLLGAIDRLDGELTEARNENDLLSRKIEELEAVIKEEGI